MIPKHKKTMRKRVHQELILLESASPTGVKSETKISVSKRDSVTSKSTTKSSSRNASNAKDQSHN
jgi:hypothetical protein